MNINYELTIQFVLAQPKKNSNDQSLWQRAYARNVRLYYPYRQYTDLFLFQLEKKQAFYFFVLCFLFSYKEKKKKHFDEKDDLNSQLYHLSVYLF